MIVITTPTGHIGSQVVTNLLAANQAVRVIVRDPARLAAEVRAKVEVVTGSSDDESILMRALEDAESLFLVVPPSFTTDDVREYYLRFTRPVCRAIGSKGVKRVVTVSGLGRRIAVNAGPVTASFAKDGRSSVQVWISALSGVPVSWRTRLHNWRRSSISPLSSPQGSRTCGLLWWRRGILPPSAPNSFSTDRGQARAELRCWVRKTCPSTTWPKF